MDDAGKNARAYLDHAANSPLRASAAEAMIRAWALAGNPSSIHTAGRRARQVLEEAREQLAGAVGVRPAEVVFTSGGTEANNLALLGALGAAGSGAEAIISAVEHPSGRKLVDQVGARAKILGVDRDGRVDSAELAELIGPATAVVSVMWVNNETGVVSPIRELAAVVQDHPDVVFHSDAVQALGHLRLDPVPQLMSISAHKVGGPVGIGALLVKRGVQLSPVGFGGGQEAKLRSGTLPVALAAGFAAAADEALAEQSELAARLAGFAAQLRTRLAAIPGVELTGAEPLSAAIVHIVVPGTRADDVLLLLDAAGVDCSPGSACTAGVHQPSEVLQAMGRTVDEAAAGLRFSMGHTTTAADIELLLRVLPAAIERARQAW